MIHVLFLVFFLTCSTIALKLFMEVVKDMKSKVAVVLLCFCFMLVMTLLFPFATIAFIFLA